jgi:hypothetical protein
MNEDQFNLLIEKLTELTKRIEASIPETQPTDISDLLKSTQKDDKLYEPEKRKIRKIAKIFKEEFETLGKDQTPLKGKKPIMVELDKESFKMLRKTLISIIPEFEKIFNNVKIKTKETSGFFGTLFKGALGIVSLLNGLKGFVLTAGAVGLLFYLIKNIEKIANSIDKILKSGKENLPEIGRTLLSSFLPFLQEAIGPINNLIAQLPMLFDILLQNLSPIRQEIVKFINEIDPVQLLKVGGAILALYTAWKAIRTVKGVSDALISPATALNNFNMILSNINLAVLSLSILGFVDAFKTFTETVEKYKDISYDSLIKAGGSLVALFGSLKVASSLIGTGDAIKGALISFIGAKGLSSALKDLADGVKPWEGISMETAKVAGAAVAALIVAFGAITAIGSAGPLPALFGAAGLLAAEGTLILGLRGIAEMFAATMDTWEKLPDVFKKYQTIDYAQISAVAGAITKLAGALALSSISGGANTVIKTFTDFWGKITGQDNPVETIRKFESLNAQKLESVSSSIEKIFNSLDRSKNIDLDKLIKTVDAAKKLTEFNEKGNIVAVPPSQKPGVQEVQPLTQEKQVAREFQPVVPAQPMANDFISRPGQTPLRFSAEDTIIGVKNPDKLNKNLLGELVKKMEDIRKEDRATLRKLSDSITKLSTTTQANNNVNMVNNSRNVTSITISPTTSKSYRDSRMS